MTQPSPPPPPPYDTSAIRWVTEPPRSTRSSARSFHPLSLFLQPRGCGKKGCAGRGFPRRGAADRHSVPVRWGGLYSSLFWCCCSFAAAWGCLCYPFIPARF